MSVAPRKVILVHSGRYDYAELELDGSIQIVGENNTGKTTLINTLQFLYISDWKGMSFAGHTEQETRSYYFPDQFSYVLFECTSLVGTVVIGYRGVAEITGGEPERFYFLGEFARDDFFNGKNVRDPDDVNRSLALKGYHRIANGRVHRDLLLPGRVDGVQGFGLVPLRQDVAYRDFRETLKNLLCLSTISQDEMKARLMMLAGVRSDMARLDCRKLFGDAYESLIKGRDEVIRLQKHEATIRALAEKLGRRNALRGELFFRWRDLRDRRKDFEARHLKTVEQHKEQRAAAIAGRNDANADWNRFKIDRDALVGEAATISAKLRKLAQDEEAFAGYPEELNRAKLNELATLLSEFDRNLYSAETENIEAILRRLQKEEAARRSCEDLLKSFGDSLLASLRRSFSDSELESITNLLNFDLLLYPTSEDGVRVKNPKALTDMLRGILEGISDQVYEDEVVRIRLRSQSHSLADYEDAEKVRSRLREISAELERLHRVQSSIRDRDTLAEGRQECQVKHQALAKELEAFSFFQADRALEPIWTREHAALKDRSDKLDEEMEARRSAATTAEVELTNLKQNLRIIEEHYAKVLKQLDECLPISGLDNEVPVAIAADFEVAINEFKAKRAQHDELHTQVLGNLSTLAEFFGDTFVANDEAETMRLLREQLDALPEKQEALKRGWDAQIHGLKRRFKQVLDDLAQLGEAATRISREFSKVKISGLKEVRLKTMEQESELALIRRGAELDELPLFSEQAETARSMAFLREVLQTNQVIPLERLFFLRFSVVGEDGQTKHYLDFKVVESHGTTITLKVLFNLLVLRSQLQKDSALVPFFLDEIQALDETNRRGVLQTAKQLGFIAITAAPESIAEVDTLYFLKPTKGRVSLKANFRMRLDKPNEVE